MVIASSVGRRTSDAEFEILATGRKRRRRRRWEVAMHPLPLPRPPPGPLPTSEASKTVVVSCHRHSNQQQHPQPGKTAAVSRAWKIRCSSSTALLQRHTHGRPASRGGGAAGPTTTTGPEKTTPATGSCLTAEERKVTKSMGRSDKAIIPHTQFMYSVNKTEYCQPLNTKKRNRRSLQLRKTSIKRNENSHSQNGPSVECCNIIKNDADKPIISANPSKNLKLLKAGLKSALSLQGDQNYAGPKFSEPPSPSVLPKPPSHWVGAHAECHDERVQDICQNILPRNESTIQIDSSFMES
ncbi:proline-rich nuclear receptor coactivator 1-like isoform X1 [Chiloscyllium plagiosum]|uniref:proline-rich nuclear receptor coactivator 1-like isoform X1 n=1 Tax=Chiloscyllium plagiosum TaxID=36176 RepID=UPI001CB8131A|nr:proline-rich nuclear receptor coactivator 1-like isoform X1 [Chiloscyllium plagiosum]